MTQTVVGIFETPDAVHAAEAALIDHGIERASLHLTSKEGGESAAGRGPSMEDIRNYLKELFGPEQKDVAECYAEEVDRGGIVLAVDVADEAKIAEVSDTIMDAGALNMEERMEQRHGSEGERSESAKAEGEGVPIIEEKLEVGKSKVGQGKVRVVSRLVETPIEKELKLKEEHATIERRPVDRPIAPGEIEAAGERTMEVEETAEKPEISKSARVVEEVRLGKESTERTETIEDTVRRTKVDVEQKPAEGRAPQGGKPSGEGGTK